MPAHEALNPELFEGAGLHPSLFGTKVPAVIRGRVARHVMHEADIVQTKADAPHITGVTEGYGQQRGYPRGTVHTSQRHLHVPTLNKYAAGDIPEHDPDDEPEHYGDTDVLNPHAFAANRPGSSYEPETYWHGDKEWMAEGHHRTIANRLGRGY